jgi:REP element-mobilizing transposase RayT
MPRKPRLDAPGVLHHVMGRGIERTEIFRDDTDRNDFLKRLATQCENRRLIVYAWVLMSDHFHLLVRTGNESLALGMKKILSGYVGNYNRRHKRWGHLFQNRYKSIVCEDDPYFLELTRYIHLNPLRAGIVISMKTLNTYRWSGQAVIMGRIKRDWQDTEAVLEYFGKRRGKAIENYAQYVEEGIAKGKRHDLTGGGLIRSMGGWAEVLSLRRKGIKVVSDDRILGCSKFIEELLSAAEERERETLRLNRKVVNLNRLAESINEWEGIDSAKLRSGGMSRKLVRARKIFSQLAVKRMGYSGAEVARYLGVTTSAVNRIANSEELPVIEKYSKLL